MSDNPFITPQNPTGAYDLPFEDLPAPRAQVVPMDAIYDQIDLEAGATPTPLGAMAVLRFHFHSSSPNVPAIAPITFLATAATMRNLARLCRDSALRAAKAAEAGQ